MAKICSKCGQHYPDGFLTCTCRLCGGTIERWRSEITGLCQKDYVYEELWQEWRKKYNAAPPRPLREDDWYNACAFFNKCSICGAPDINEELLVIPPFLGGKRYVHNVVPACSTCAKRIRQSQSLNPIKSFYTIDGSDKKSVDLLFRYLDGVMLGVVLEFFNYEEDSLEITVVCTETTSVKPFKGIYAKRVFEEPPLTVLRKDHVYETVALEETTGVTWRLVDESDIE